MNKNKAPRLSQRGPEDGTNVLTIIASVPVIGRAVLENRIARLENRTARLENRTALLEGC